MSFNPPFLNNPYFRHNSFYKPLTKPYHYNNSVTTNANVDSSNSKNNPDETIRNSNTSESRDFFEIFGIKLYYDDILLISLIFFLYSEGVDDSELFIALILLLLS